MGVFDEEDPLSLHMLGMHGSAYANFAIQARSIPALSVMYPKGGGGTKSISPIVHSGLCV